MTGSHSFRLASRQHPAFSSASPTSTTILRRSWFTQRNWEGKREGLVKQSNVQRAHYEIEWSCPCGEHRFHVVSKETRESPCSQNQNPQEKGCAKNPNQSITTPKQTILNPL